MIILYIISVLIIIISVRYDSDFDKDDPIIFLIFCPFINSLLALYEIINFSLYLCDKNKLDLDESVLKFIRLKKNEKRK